MLKNDVEFDTSDEALVKRIPNDQKQYAKLKMPVLGLGAEYTGWHWLQITGKHAADFRLEKVEDSGHFIVMEQPEFVTERLLYFFDRLTGSPAS